MSNVPTRPSRSDMEKFVAGGGIVRSGGRIRTSAGELPNPEDVTGDTAQLESVATELRAKRAADDIRLNAIEKKLLEQGRLTVTRDPSVPQPDDGTPGGTDTAQPTAPSSQPEPGPTEGASDEGQPEVTFTAHPDLEALINADNPPDESGESGRPQGRRGRT